VADFQITERFDKSGFHIGKIQLMRAIKEHTTILRRLLVASAASKRHAAFEGPVRLARGAEVDTLGIDLSPRKNNNRLRHLSIIASNRS
jgi:hypothetical protein